MLILTWKRWVKNSSAINSDPSYCRQPCCTVPVICRGIKLHLESTFVIRLLLISIPLNGYRVLITSSQNQLMPLCSVNIFEFSLNNLSLSLRIKPLRSVTPWAFIDCFIFTVDCHNLVSLNSAQTAVLHLTQKRMPFPSQSFNLSLHLLHLQ